MIECLFLITKLFSLWSKSLLIPLVVNQVQDTADYKVERNGEHDSHCCSRYPFIKERMIAAERLPATQNCTGMTEMTASQR